jgi:preprotein translocase subunit SecE
MSKVGAYIKESYIELRQKVSWPTFAELQDSVVIVMIASMIIALIIFVMDLGFQTVMNLFYKMIG